MILRPYQNSAVESIYTYFMANNGNPLVAMPTGTGKSVVIGDFVRGIYRHYPNQRVMMLTHVKELIEQNYEKLVTLWPTAPAGIYSASIGRKETHFPITFAGIASVAKKAAFFRHIDLLLIDEAHLVGLKESTMYLAFIAELKKYNPSLKVVGFTATPYRLGLGKLTEGGLFTDTCFDMTGVEAFNWLIDEGYLIKLVPKRTGMMFDVSEVGMSGGEYKQSELQFAVDKHELTYAAVRETVEYGADRKKWLLFASGVEHAEHVASMLEYFGISTCVIHSKMSDADRTERIKGLKAGKYRAAVNNNVLTTGFDDPEIDLISCLRPSGSPGLWVQMLGRGTRPDFAPGFDTTTKEGRLAAIAASTKHDCLVLDFAGNTRRLGPINDPVIPRAKGKGGNGTAPVRICEACNTYNHASARVCAHCGADFPRELKINQTAYTEEIVKTAMPQVELFKVDRVIYARHESRRTDIIKPPTLKVSYYCGLRMFSEYVCFEHSGFPLHKAHEWWRARSWDEPPVTVNDAVASINALQVPTHLRIWVKKQNDEILAWSFDNGSTFKER